MDVYAQAHFANVKSLWEQPVFFLHVPKTAGTAVRHFLEASLQPHQIHRVEDTETEVRDRTLGPLPPEVRFASAHLPYWYRDAFCDPARLLIFMRHPVERTLSTYRFWRGLPAPADKDRSASAELLRKVQSVSLEEFATTQGVWWGAVSNYASWLIGHNLPWNLNAPADALTSRLARSRLASADMIGVCERMDESLTLIARELGTPLTRGLPAVNVSSHASLTERAPASVVRALIDANEDDMALWEIANQELDSRLRAAKPVRATARPRPRAGGTYAPKPRPRGLELRPGTDAILGEGWLSPEGGTADAWRFAAAPGPARLYVQWPMYSAEYALIIECPFAAQRFNYDALQISIDGKRVDRIITQLHDRTVIITRAIAESRAITRTISFEYEDPYAEVATTKRSHAQQAAFAISSIRWMPMEDDDWRITREVGALAEAAAAVAKRNAEGLTKLEAMIAKKDEYIASLVRALNEKDAYTLSLQQALEAKVAELQETHKLIGCR